MSNSDYLIYDLDLKPELNRLAGAHRPKGADKPLFKMDEAFPFQPSFSINSKQLKRIQTDQLLRKLLEKISQPIYDKMLTDLETEVKNCAGKCVDGSPDLDALWKSLVETITTAGNKIVKDSHDQMATYLLDRSLGKAAVQKYQAKKGKGLMMTTLGVASIGGAIASAVASFGATTPAVLVAFYGTYKAVRETQDAFKKAARSHDEYAESIQKTIAILKEKYDGATEEEKRAWTAAGEVKSKIGKELIGFTGQSIKKLEESIKGYDKAVEIGFYLQSRLGKQVGELIKKIEKANETMKDLVVELNAVDDKKRSKILDKVRSAKGTLDKLQEKSDRYLTEAEACHTALLDAKGASAVWAQIATDLKANRPDWVRHVSKPLKLTGLALAVAGQDYGSAADQGALALVEVGGAIGGEIATLVAENKKKAKDKK